MATSHLCLEHPDFDKDQEKWREGSVTGCPYHNHNRNMPRVRMSAKDIRKADGVKGTVGVQRDGYIHGPEGQ